VFALGWRDVDEEARRLRLEQKGLVRSRIGAPTPERGGRRRRHFELLPLGARSLRDAYRALTRMTAGIERRLRTLS
jgi:hypothetical protein